MRVHRDSVAAAGYRLGCGLGCVAILQVDANFLLIFNGLYLRAKRFGGS